MYSSVFFRGAYEPHNSAVVGEWLQPGDVALDVGANYGWFSVLMSAAVGPTGRVVAVEPLPPMIAEWRANRQLNPSLSMTLVEAAVGSRPGEVVVHLFAGLPHGHASVSTFGRRDFTAYRVPVTTLDAIAVEQAGRVDFVKIDVEGFELSVIQGATGLLTSSDPPSLLIEVNYETSEAQGFRPIDMISTLRAHHDYAIWRVDRGTVTVEDDPKNAPQDASWLAVADRHIHRMRAYR